jgi:hypothetical protein
MTQMPGLMLSGLLILICLWAGVLGNRWWTDRAAKARRRIPQQWPLEPRAMANSQERKVWRWLDRVFFDQHVMVKIPVTRFTLPRAKENSEHWYQLLSGVYCTFTVCRDDGQVVGCVDVPGVNGISRGNMQLKVTLLSQCGIAYCVVEPNSLPPLEEIRADFLGSHAAPVKKDLQGASMTTAHDKLRAAVDRQRHKRASADGSDSLSPSTYGSGAWQQPDSFIAPLDSRPGKLH